MDIAQPHRPGFVLDVPRKGPSSRQPWQGIGVDRINIAETEETKEAIVGCQLMVEANVEGVLIIFCNRIEKELICGPGHVRCRGE